MKTVALHDENPEFYQSLDVLSQALQLVKGQVEKHLWEQIKKKKLSVVRGSMYGATYWYVGAYIPAPSCCRRSLAGE